MINIDPKKIEDIIRHVSATEVMPRYNNLKDADVRQKNPGDFVTVADEASERAFTKLLAEALPGSLVVGEEAVSKDPKVLELLKQDKPVWVIDPIDGTYNYAHNKRHFGILIALVQNGVTQYGWAFDPIGDRMAFAQKGHGAFINSKRVTIDCKASDMNQLKAQGGGRNIEAFTEVIPNFKSLIVYRCSLHDFMNFISGDADVVVHLNKVTPWDHAAAVLLAEEAGGYVALDADGIDYDPTRHGKAFLLAAPDKARWLKLHAILYPALHR